MNLMSALRESSMSSAENLMSALRESSMSFAEGQYLEGALR